MENDLPPEPAPQGPPKKNLLDKVRALPGKIAKIPASFGNLFKKLFRMFKGVFGVFKKPVDAVTAVFGKLFSRFKKKEIPTPFQIEEPRSGFIHRHRFKIVILIVVAAAAFVIPRFLTKPEKPKISLEETLSEPAQPKVSVIAVKAFKVGRFNYEDSLNVLGTVKGAMEFKLSFEVPGVVSSINYREGERYEEGALLLSLRQDDILLRLKRAQAELNKADTGVQLAQEKVTEHEKLFAMGAIPKQTLDKVKIELDGAKYDSEAARLELKAHESMLEKSNLYAPSAGMIGELKIEEGETVTPNTLLGSHIMTEYVYAEFGVVEREVNKIALGQKARVFIDAYPDKTFEGVIENIAPVVGGTSRTATSRIRIENPERLLLPGMFSRIRILLYSKKNALVVPTDALQGGEGDQWIFIVHEEDEVAEKRAISVGYTRPDYSQIDAGISEGELVAVTGLERLEDGAKVRLLETQEAEA
ncbi:MAG: efflux RND transporter periplasmic adaptor subunit [Candidatus Omnitrophota bacterium]|nr:efflux RND transporter periplasmic adaptor subunit [Candidatus Omnitrophota bacterium]